MGVIPHDRVGEPALDRPVPHLQPDPIPARLFWPALVGVIAAAAAVVGWFGRTVYLWSDDYVFLFDAQGKSVTLDQLKVPLFGHFSPVSQFTDVLVAANLPEHPWLIHTILLSLTTGVVAAVAFLMAGLFGRTWLTLIGTAVAGPSLGLLPLANWWTAGVNIMPAMIGVALCLGGTARLVRGRSAWWAVPTVGGYLLAVLAWELGMTAVGYAAVWTLLFRTRVSTEPWQALLRRTWPVWAVLLVIAAWSLWNYKTNYYVATASPTPELALEALGTSLLTIQLPMSIGVYDLTRPGFQLTGIVVSGIVLVALVVFTLLRSRRAWRGWSFALLGWLIPLAAVTLSRVGYIGIPAIQQSMYYYLPTLLFLVGVFEAWAAPWRPDPHAAPATGFRRPRTAAVAAVAVGALALGTAWISSAWPTISSTNYSMIGPPGAPIRSYVPNLVASAQAEQATGEPFSVINGGAPSELMQFQDHRWLSRVVSVHDPSIPFNAPDGPWYVPDDTGTLVPATISWAAATDPGSPFADLTSAGLTPVGTAGCFTVDTADASLRWDLPAPVSGGPLVVRTMATVEAATPVRVSTVTETGGSPVGTAVSSRPWTPGETGRLDTPSEPQVVAVVLDSMTVGTSMCLDSIEVGTVSRG
ncbi:hypothetical protein [Nakamurella sp.]|uniref:hypothetical protein n=1 Tax=Nakamurella sp. TaxID=1869182 RepID=UPI003B3A7E9D